LEIVKDETKDVPLAFEELFYRFDGYEYTLNNKKRL